MGAGKIAVKVPAPAKPAAKKPQKKTSRKPQSVRKFQTLKINADFAVPKGEPAKRTAKSEGDWRIEKRHRKNKNGEWATYWNYRSRKPQTIDGKRVVPYRKGGTWNGKK